jgi:hypothetical protein
MRPWYAGVFALVLALFAFTSADPDLWGHVRFGLDFLDTWALPSVDPYSFTQDRPWINHEWLSEAMMAAAYRGAGAPGLALLKAVLTLAVFVWIWRALRGARTGARLAVATVVWFGTVHITSSIRPQVWTFLCLAVLWQILMEHSARRRIWLPMLFVFWVNVHGGWIVGLGVLGVWAAVQAIIEPRAIRGWAVVCLACAAATLCNPYGWDLWRFMAETVRPTREIDEWGALWGTPLINWIPWFAAVGGMLVAVRHRTPNRAAITAVLAMLAYGAATVMRIESLFIESAAFALAPTVRHWWPARPVANSLPPRRVPTAAAVLLLSMPLAAAVWIGRASLGCIAMVNPALPERTPARWLAAGEPGRLVTAFGWGQYAIWHLGPRLRVSMDGRRETIYSAARLAQHDAILAGSTAGLVALAEWRAEYVWLPATSRTTKEWLRDHGYRVDVETPQSFVAVRGDLPLLLAPTDDVQAEEGHARCFPD